MRLYTNRIRHPGLQKQTISGNGGEKLYSERSVGRVFCLGENLVSKSPDEMET